jgi:NAD+ synthase
MAFTGNTDTITERQKEVLAIYKHFNTLNKHKMEPIPVCLIPLNLK